MENGFPRAGQEQRGSRGSAAWGGRGSACFLNHCFTLASEALPGVVKEVLFKVVKVTVESALEERAGMFSVVPIEPQLTSREHTPW